MATVTEKTAIPTGIWKSDPVHSTVGFSVKHMVVATFRGSFTDFGVTLDNDDGEPVLYGAVRVDSVDVRDENLKGHLLSPDFFDAERDARDPVHLDRHPDRGRRAGRRRRAEIKGTSRPVEARGTIVGPVAEHRPARSGVGIDLSTTVDRREFGLNWNAPLPKRRLRGRERGHAHVPPRAREGGVVDAGAGNLRKPAARLPQHPAPQGGGTGRAATRTSWSSSTG